MTMRYRAALGLLALLAPGAARAQNSVYGIAGIGFPGEPISVRARALGGGVAAFDPTSALNPATVAGLGRLAAGLSFGTTLRRYTTADSTITGLRETRFPFGVFGGRITRTPVSFALSFATYTERSYDVTATATQVLRGDTVQITDRIASDGAVTDLRGALAFHPWAPLMIGGAFHLLGGSSRLNVLRTFSNTAYLPFTQQRELVFSGTGVSGGVVLRPTRAIEMAGAVRVDGRLTSRIGQEEFGSVELPVSLTTGLRLLPLRGLGWSTTATRRSWSVAQPDLPTTTRAFDTWEIASGLELADREALGAGIPIRLGVRYRQLPFSTVATQPTELVLAGGSGLFLARGRAVVDFAVEHLSRKGGGADERGWHISMGVTVIP